MNIWTKLLITKEPSDLSAHDWKELRRMATQVTEFEIAKGESTASKSRRLLQIIGFESFSDIKGLPKQILKDIFLVLEVQKHCIERGQPISKICEKQIPTYDGNYIEGQTLRNEYYAARERIKHDMKDEIKEVDEVVDFLFKNFMDCTVEQYKNSVAVKNIIRTRTRPMKL